MINSVVVTASEQGQFKGSIQPLKESFPKVIDCNCGRSTVNE